MHVRCIKLLWKAGVRRHVLMKYEYATSDNTWEFKWSVKFHDAESPG